MRLKSSDRHLASVRNHQRLGQTGDAFQNAVAPAEERDQQLFDDLILADDDAGQLVLDFVEAVHELADGVEIVVGQLGRHRGFVGNR